MSPLPQPIVIDRGDVLIVEDPRSRDIRRSHRKRAVRAKVIQRRRITQWELEQGRALYPDEGIPRPRTRAECKGHKEPCPFVSCKYHLYLDVTPNGGIKVRFPDLEPWEIEETCALDVADRGGKTLERVGDLCNMTRERVRQIEEKAKRRLRLLLSREMFETMPEEEPCW